MEIRELGKNDVIHCSTLEEALAICQLMHDNGLKWCNGKTYIAVNDWNTYEENTCYRPYDGTYTEIDYFKRYNHNIIPASQFLNSDNYEIY